MNRKSTYTLLGITDERTTCECCGKSNLKRVVALRIDNSEVVYYGTTCAAKALKGAGIKTTTSALNSEVLAVAYAQKWLDAGRNIQKVADATYKKFGFLTQVKGDALYIHPFAVVRANA